MHERELQELVAGAYRIGAFARDRTANLFGGAGAELVLPNPRKRGLVGPFLMLPERPYLRAPLPPLKKRPGETPRRASAVRGRVPAGKSVRAGEPLEVVSLLCTGTDVPPDAARVLRYVTREEAGLFRFDAATFEAAGDCWRFVDRVETASLEPGRYDYHVRWQTDARDAPMEADATFHVVSDAEPAQETAAR